jgi:uncharacterized protein YcfL
MKKFILVFSLLFIVGCEANNNANISQSQPVRKTLYHLTCWNKVGTVVIDRKDLNYANCNNTTGCYCYDKNSNDITTTPYLDCISMEEEQ